MLPLQQVEIRALTPRPMLVGVVWLQAAAMKASAVVEIRVLVEMALPWGQMVPQCTWRRPDYSNLLFHPEKLTLFNPDV